MDRLDICCIGHVTLDKVVTARSVVHMAGGTAFYFSTALARMDTSYALVTALAEAEMDAVAALRARRIKVTTLPSAHTVYFENIYSENQDHRIQRVLQIADPFTVAQLDSAQAKIFHLGPLLSGDIPLELIRTLSKKGKVSLDAQGYLRKVEDQQVLAVDWPDKKEALQYIDILKVNESEMAVLSGQKEIREGAKVFGGMGRQRSGHYARQHGIGHLYGPAVLQYPGLYPSHVCGRRNRLRGYLYGRLSLSTDQRSLHPGQR